ncbi:MAG: hypothetical protein K6F68_00835 [Clostridiales bacterium]|nr:hypothetical protein [Clostridiales bacterium]
MAGFFAALKKGHFVIYELIGGVKTLSVIGMCKNAGKTTVLNSAILECEERGETLGLTSIGRDGERSDLVTNTKKPEIFVKEGAVIATAEGLVPYGDVSREILEKTGIPTPMGEIIIFRARSSGFVQLGGASTTQQQKQLRDALFGFGCTRVLIDGAISRKSLGNPALADGVILSSGASYDPDMEKTAADTAYIASLFSLKEAGVTVSGGTRFEAVTERGRFFADELNELTEPLKAGAEWLIMNGAVTDMTARELLNSAKLLKNTRLAAMDASRLLLKKESFDKLTRFTRGFSVIKSTRLLAVTVNAFSAYGMHYDADEFIKKVRARLAEAGVSAQVLDVKNA